MTDIFGPPPGSRLSEAVRSNGPDSLALERYKLRELAEGWPCYRFVDRCKRMGELLLPLPPRCICIHDMERVNTLYGLYIRVPRLESGKGPLSCIAAMASPLISHAMQHSVTKMKATITQQFTLGEIEVDAESDCRFYFFWIKAPETGDGKAMLVRHWYEKDKLIPVDPRKIPGIDEKVLMKYPSGYRYLAYCQQKTVGVDVAADMPVT